MQIELFSAPAIEEGRTNIESNKGPFGDIPANYQQWLIADKISGGYTSWEEFFSDLKSWFRVIGLLKEVVPQDRRKPEQFLTNCLYLMDVGLVSTAPPELLMRRERLLEEFRRQHPYRQILTNLLRTGRRPTENTGIPGSRVQ